MRQEELSQVGKEIFEAIHESRITILAMAARSRECQTRTTLRPVMDGGFTSVKPPNGDSIL
ncbi:hypothetical protein K438DRAFT_1825745 [Mycena galopus ATCC 62051]|nr:hypothetical protein K438DRAFT_1825745 [Mycena galopus ATCC 62051]